MPCKLVRIEHSEEKNTECGIEVHSGPYRNRQFMSLAVSEKMNNLPTPDYDWWPMDRSKIFAFQSAEVMFRWFTPEVQAELSRMGYVISFYEVPIEHILHDRQGIQCAFNPRHAVLKKRLRWEGEQTAAQLLAA